MKEVGTLDTIPWDELHASEFSNAKSPTKLSAYCNSALCTSHEDPKTNGVEKIVPKHVSFCPDCSSALFWMRILPAHARRNNTVSSKKSKYSKGS